MHHLQENLISWNNFQSHLKLKTVVNLMAHFKLHTMALCNEGTTTSSIMSVNYNCI